MNKHAYKNIYDYNVKKKYSKVMYSDRIKNEYIFKNEIKIQPLASSENLYYGNVNFNYIPVKYIMQKYLLNDDNLNYIINNSHNVYFFMANIDCDKYLMNNELKWHSFLGNDIIDEWNFLSLRDSSISKNIIPLGFLQIKKVEDTIDLFSIENIQTFYNGNFESLFIDKISTTKNIQPYIQPYINNINNTNYSYSNNTYSISILSKKITSVKSIIENNLQYFTSRQVKWTSDLIEKIYLGKLSNL